MNHNFQLQTPVEQFFQAINTEDPTTLLWSFAEDAVVLDAGKEYQGKTAIQEWSNHDCFGDHLRLEVINAVMDTAELVVTVIADGDYDKKDLPNPLYLDFYFTVKEDKITRLRTALSSNGRAISLPPPVSMFYNASNLYDEDMLADCFSADAMLIDEEIEYHGAKDVSRHILKANKEAEVLTVIERCVNRYDESIVTATLSGKFEGSPLPLDFHFSLESGKIKALNIALAEK